MDSLKHRQLTEKIIGIFYDVYNELGHGYLESIYEQALELEDAGLRVERQVCLQVHFRGRLVGEFRADLIVEGCVLIELKASRRSDESFEKQTLNYLRGTKLEVGLLFNFGARPEFRRLVFENERKESRVHPRKSAAGVS